MKTKLGIICLLIGLVLSGCEKDFLDLSDPNRLTAENYWNTETDAFKALTAAYGDLQGGRWEQYEVYKVAENYKSDDLMERPDPPDWVAIYNYTMNPDNSVINDLWRLSYGGIYKSNLCIENIPRISADESIKKQMIGEAKFLRAWYYFRLLNYYKNIPLVITTSKTSADYYQPQATTEAVWAQIESDLRDAKAVLPASYSSEYYGRATKGAAAAYLGKAYLYQKKWTQAAAEFSEVMGMGYSLTTNFFDNFDGMHKNNKESVFEIQFSADRTNGATESNVTMYEIWSDGYEECYPSPWLVETLLKDKTADGKYSQRVYNTILFNDPNSSAWFTNGSYADYYGADSKTVYWKKFNYYSATWNTTKSRSPINNVAMRYADVLLMYAEAQNEAGKTTDAINAINQVRTRAGVPVLPSSKTQTDIRDHIRNVERPIELAFESVRWPDLVRWGNVKETLTAHKREFSENFIAGKNEYYPIPRTEMQTNPKLVQNTGY